MKKPNPSTKSRGETKKGYNEHNPGQSQGAFPPDSRQPPSAKGEKKSNTADKKAKEDQN